MSLRHRIKRGGGLGLGIFIFSWLSLLAFQEPVRRVIAAGGIELAGRSVRPGEVFLASLQENSGIQSAAIEFLGEKYFLGSTPSGSFPLALVGLDLEMKPGFYSMVISLEYEDGRKSLVKKDIEIYTRDFPVKKMQIKEEYVTPPAEALKRIEQEAQLLREIYSRPAPVWLARGKFIAPHPGRTAANFGEIRIYNNIRQSTHSGLDVDAETGSLVLASNSGNVALARELYYAGNAVIIDHGLGLFTFYCHFSRLKVKAGDFVEKGDPIGEVGATGRVTGPHLHWGVRVLGSRVDPDSLLSLPLEKL